MTQATTRPATCQPAPGESVSAPFWAATARGELIIQWCRDCESGVHYPRLLCPHCGGTDLEWRPSRGRGIVYAVALHPDPAGDRAVALVDLDEGVRLLTQIVGIPAVEATVGMGVRVTWLPIDDGRVLPVFEPSP